MNREFLKDLGLADEAIEAVMAEYGKGIQAEADKHKDDKEKLQSDLKSAQKTISKMEKEGGDVERVQALADSYKEKFEKEEAKRKEEAREYETRIALSALGAKEKYLGTLKGLLKEVDLEDLQEEAKKIKEDYSELFVEDAESQKEPITQAPGYRILPDPQGQGSKPTMTKEEIMAIEDTEKRQAMIAEHLDLFY